MDGRFSGWLVGIIVLAVLFGVIAARSQPKTVAAPAVTMTPTPIPTPGPLQVNIVPNPNGNVPQVVYAPTRIIVGVGQTITWTNLDSQAQSVTADDGSFNSGDLAQGQSFKWKAVKPGIFTYGDIQDPNAHGIVQVVGTSG